MNKARKIAASGRGPMLLPSLRALRLRVVVSDEGTRTPRTVDTDDLFGLTPGLSVVREER